MPTTKKKKHPAATRSPVAWFGGKARMAPRIVELMPPHRVYVEPFGGSASVLLAKPPAPVEVYNDADSGLVNFFRVLRDRDQAARLHMLASNTPYSREEHSRCLDTWRDQADPVERAYRWLVVARMSFSGIFGRSWSFCVAKSTRGMACGNAAWLGSHELIGRAHSRLIRVQVEHLDFRRVIETYDTPQTLFYLDPPYAPHTRRDGKYAHELSDDDHRDLADRLLALEGMAILSGYPTPLYDPLEQAGWRRIDASRACIASGRTRASGQRGPGSCTAGQQRTESLWLCPKTQKG